MVCFTWQNNLSLIPCPRYDAEGMTVCGLVPNSEITTLTLANHQLFKTPCYTSPCKQTAQQWAKPPQLWKDFSGDHTSGFESMAGKRCIERILGTEAHRLPNHTGHALYINNIHASIVSEIPCYVCCLKACGINLKQPLQLAYLLSWWMEHGGWERKLHLFSPPRHAHILE